MSLENLSIDARDELAALAQQLAETPSTRKRFLRMTKEIKPDLPIPELEIEESTNKALSLAEQRVQSLENKLREKDALDDLQRRRNAIKAKGLVSTEDDIKEVEKIMLDRGITNHETAAEYHQWMKQSATPTPSGYNPQIIQKMDLNKYWKNPVTAARNEAVSALQELRRPNRPIGL
jgi:hypothetical protein